MRRTVLLIALGLALASGTACSSTPTSTDPQTAPTTGAAAKLDEIAVTCTGFTDVMTQGALKLSEHVMALLEAESDPAKFAALVKTVADLMAEMATKLGKTVETAGDAELKAVLTEVVNALNKTKTEVMGTTDMAAFIEVNSDSALDTAEEKAKTLCK